MPIHRGPRLDDMVMRLPVPVELQANLIQTFPSLANGISVSATVWTEIIAAASAPASPFTVLSDPHQLDMAGLGTYAELGIGAVGSEKAIAARGGLSYCFGAEFYPFPIIPGGTRVSLRGDGSTGQSGCGLITMLAPTARSADLTIPQVSKAQRLSTSTPGPYTGPPAFQKIPYNHATCSSGSGAAWTFGTWTEQLASTVVTDDSLVTYIEFQVIYNFDVWTAGYQHAIQLGYGGVDGANNAPDATWCEVTFEQLEYGKGNYQPHLLRLPFPIRWPKNKRLAIRAANSTGNAGGSYRAQLCGIKGLYFP